jgi:hypothetical protein
MPQEERSPIAPHLTGLADLLQKPAAELTVSELGQITDALRRVSGGGVGHAVVGELLSVSRAIFQTIEQMTQSVASTLGSKG